MKIALLACAVVLIIGVLCCGCLGNGDAKIVTGSIKKMIGQTDGKTVIVYLSNGEEFKCTHTQRVQLSELEGIHTFTLVYGEDWWLSSWN